MNLTGNLIVNLNGERPDELFKFYRDTVGLKPNPAMGETALLAATTPFIIDGHSEVEGKAKEPPRTMFNFAVDDVHAEMARLEAAGVEFLGPPSDQLISFATFLDPDGNYCQIFTMGGAPAGLDLFVVARTSGDAEKLRAFYTDVLGVPVGPPDMGSPLMVGDTWLYVSPHSEVSGQAKEPPRVLLNFMVDDLAAEQQRIESRGVKFIRTAGREPWGGVISTFLDPDGNYLQLMAYHP